MPFMSMFRRRKPDTQTEDVEDVARTLAGLTINANIGRSRASAAQRGKEEFVGGFHPETTPRQERNRLTKPLPSRPPDASTSARDGPIEFPNAQVYTSQSNGRLPSVAMSMPVPYYEDSRPQSLTMQYALGQPATPYGLSPAARIPIPSRPDVTTRPHSDHAVPSRPPTTESISAARLKVPVTPQRPTVTHVPASAPSKVTLSQINISTPPATPSPIARAVSSPPSPISTRSRATSAAGNIKVQCSGRTQKGLRCKNRVAPDIPFESMNEDEEQDEEDEPEFFCRVHESQVLSPKEIVLPQTSKKLLCSDFIPGYLQSSTQASLRAQMQKPISKADEPGFIYAYEVQEPSLPHHFHIKVGRTTEPNRRMPQWTRQCPSKNATLLGLWPEDPRNAFLRGIMQHGDPGPSCHRLESLIHIELKDIITHAPYLDPAFPQVKASKFFPTPPVRKPCVDCKVMHKEIFSFPRATSGPYKGKEFELLVKPVIERWSKFVREHCQQTNSDNSD